MNLLGLPVATWALGLAGLAAALLALHLLRVRLRRQTVDSLLFFRQVGAVRKPRVLLGSPARWLSFVLGLLLLAALWTAFARPRATGDGPSRVVLVDATAAAAWNGADGTTLHATFAARAATLADAGLGPRGRVVQFGEHGATLWEDGEPVQRIAERAAAQAADGTAGGLWPALLDAARTLRAGDEIVLLGGPADVPTEVGGIPIRRGAAATAPGELAVIGVRRTDGPPPQLVVDVATGGADAVVRARQGDAVVAEAAIRSAPGATARATLGPLPAAVGELVVDVTSGTATSRPAVVAGGRSKPIAVFVAPDAPDVVRLAIAADPLTVEATADQAEVDVVVGDRTGARPTLSIEAGAGADARAPRRTAACPLPLSLRDRGARAAPALANPGALSVWIEDAASGAALAGAEVDGARRRVRTVAWLLDDASHRDVPALVMGAVRWLAGAEPTASALAAPPSGGAATEPELDARSPGFPWVPALLVAALLALALDTWLYARGRLA